MDVEKVYSDIQMLPRMAAGIRQRTPEAIKFLQRVYQTVTGATVYAGCKGCHLKAANYLMSLSIQNLIDMSNQKFKLKKGVSIEWPFRSGQRLNEGNITDAKAADYLFNNPAGISNFADYPKDDDKIDFSSVYPDEYKTEEPAPTPEPKKSKKVEQTEVTE